MDIARTTRRPRTARLVPLLLLLVLGASACADLALPSGGDVPDDASADVTEEASEAASEDGSETASEPASESASEPAPDAGAVTPITAAQVQLVCTDDAARDATAAELGVPASAIADVCGLLLPTGG